MSNHLLEDVFTAYYDARRNKRNTKSQLQFEMQLEHNLMQLYKELRDRSYRPSPCICFITLEPVCREIFASSFRDRVVHHLLFNYIAPLFETTFIEDSYACRKEKGTLKGIKRFEHHLRSCSHNFTRDVYVLKLDIKGYFMSIDKQILRQLIRQEMERKRQWAKQIDQTLVDFLIDLILLRDPTSDACIVGKREEWEGLPHSKSLFHSAKGTGLPIGDLTSQLFSNIYLNQLDQFAKRTLGLRHYGRYVDDFYVIDEDRMYLLSLIEQLRVFLKEKLHLTLHPHKIYLQSCWRGTPFLGAFVKPYRRYPRSRTVGRFHREMQCIKRRCLREQTLDKKEVYDLRSTINSYGGYLAHFKSFHLLRGTLDVSAFYRYFIFHKGFRKASVKRAYK